LKRKEIKKKKPQSNLLYPTKLPFRNEGERLSPTSKS
jgi:hypothetical protein